MVFQKSQVTATNYFSFDYFWEREYLGKHHESIELNLSCLVCTVPSVLPCLTHKTQYIIVEWMSDSCLMDLITYHLNVDNSQVWIYTSVSLCSHLGSNFVFHYVACFYIHLLLIFKQQILFKTLLVIFNWTCIKLKLSH